MSENEIGIEPARAILGDLANRAHYAGQVTYLTRRGRRVAAIVPLDRIKENHMTATVTAADIVVTLDRSDEDDGWNWADAALEQWTAAAEQAGLRAEVISTDVPDENHDAAIVTVNGREYVITVRNDEISARPYRTYTLISAAVGDRVPEGAVEISDPACPLDWHDLPEDAASWAISQGYNLGNPDELLYVVRGDVQVDGWPTYRVEL